MMKQQGTNLPIKMWLEEIEDGALEQAKNLARLPFAFKHIALMPDCHQGYGMPIGGVMATKGVIVPNAVGVDIGCGMCAVKTSLTNIEIGALKNILGEIRKQIPVGFNHHKEKQQEEFEENVYLTDNVPEGDSIIFQQYDKAQTQIGTLGGGNHFIEIQKGDDGHIWIMIHSGSRNLGFTVAKHYNDLAKELNKKWYTSIPLEYDLAFLPLDSEEGQDYIKEMDYCIEFALANRKLMMDRVKAIFVKINGLLITNFDEMINIAHNYATMESHFRENVMIHRKGATLARKGTIGIIPGSQGTKSYIVEGLGNKDSFESCSHGAGRKMGRKQAQEKLDIKKETKLLEDQGILHSIRNTDDLDEAPGAYKDISTVMDNQKDLVKILVELTPLAVIKG